MDITVDYDIIAQIEPEPSEEDITLKALELLGKLSESEKILVRRFYYDGASLIDVAQELNISHPACKVRSHRLRRKVENLVLKLT